MMFKNKEIKQEKAGGDFEQRFVVCVCVCVCLVHLWELSFELRQTIRAFENQQ